MTPREHFDNVWIRCSFLTALHAYLVRNATGALHTDELLRAEWVSRVSALDLYVHERVAEGMLAVFDGQLTATHAYRHFTITNDVLDGIRGAANSTAARAAFDLYIRSELAKRTFQFPDDIADGMRLFGIDDLWNKVALGFGASTSTQNEGAKEIKLRLSLIIRRRNIITHEGDLRPSLPREAFPISRVDLLEVTEFIERLVHNLNSIAPDQLTPATTTPAPMPATAAAATTATP